MGVGLLLVSLASFIAALENGAAATHLQARGGWLSFAPSPLDARFLSKGANLRCCSQRRGTAVSLGCIRMASDDESMVMSALKIPAALHDTAGVPFKGVSQTKSGKFASGIWLSGAAKHLGTYEIREDAATAYDRHPSSRFPSDQ